MTVDSTLEGVKELVMSEEINNPAYSPRGGGPEIL